MRRFLSLVFVIALVFLLSVFSFATIDSDRPPFPDYVSKDGEILIPYDRNATAITTRFFEGDKEYSSFDTSPHLIVQGYWGTPNNYSEVVGFVRINPDIGNRLRFEYFGDVGNFGGKVNAMIRSPVPNGNAFDVLTYIYDSNTNSLRYHTAQSENNLYFNYVLNSSPLSGKIENYPGFSTISGNLQFDSFLSVTGQSYKTPLYNWWAAHDGGGIVPPNPDINIDTDGDGKPDINIDTDGDEKPDINIDTDGDKKPDINVDTNGDGKPDTDIDTDGDKKPDINIDTDGDKKPDTNIDTDGDKKPDTNIDTDGDKKPDINIDTNGDKKPDINIDTDGDEKPDINIDTDGDKKPDINIDTNGDKKPDINIDTDGDKEPDTNVDTDGDGKPDTDIDTDGDGLPDQNVSGGGSSGGGSTPGGGHPDIGNGSDFVPDDSYKPHYNEWNLFDPYDYKDRYKSPFDDDLPYDPLEGWEIPQKMPSIPTTPNFGDYNFHNPFQVPEWAKE